MVLQGYAQTAMNVEPLSEIAVERASVKVPHEVYIDPREESAIIFFYHDSVVVSPFATRALDALCFFKPQSSIHFLKSIIGSLHILKERSLSAKQSSNVS